jgi:hypothetical protein
MAGGISIKEFIAAGRVTMDVYRPTGAMEEATSTYAPRPADLRGKAICELSNGLWEDHRTFPFIRALLQKRIPDVKIIPYTDLPMGTRNIDVEDIGDIVKRTGCHAVIVGNSG